VPIKIEILEIQVPVKIGCDEVDARSREHGQLAKMSSGYSMAA